MYTATSLSNVDRRRLSAVAAVLKPVRMKKAGMAAVVLMGLDLCAASTYPRYVLNQLISPFLYCVYNYIYQLRTSILLKEGIVKTVICNTSIVIVYCRVCINIQICTIFICIMHHYRDMNGGTYNPKSAWELVDQRRRVLPDIDIDQHFQARARNSSSSTYNLHLV